MPANVSVTAEEYLAFERAYVPQGEIVRHEFVNGEILAMAGGSAQHAFLTSNTLVSLATKLPAGCRAIGPDLKVAVERFNSYFLPDVSVVCSQPEFLSGNPDCLVNPIVLVEVLSPGTERYDRITKFRHYQTIPSLRHYLLISQDRVLVEHFERLPDDRWAYLMYFQRDSVLRLRDPDVEVPLDQIYAGIEFETSPSF